MSLPVDRPRAVGVMRREEAVAVIISRWYKNSPLGYYLKQALLPQR